MKNCEMLGCWGPEKLSLGLAAPCWPFRSRCSHRALNGGLGTESPMLIALKPQKERVLLGQHTPPPLTCGLVLLLVSPQSC